MPATVRIDPIAHAALAAIARAHRLSLTEALSRAVAAYGRDVFLDGVVGDFASLRANAKAWAEEQAERRAWEPTMADGLDDERDRQRVAVNATKLPKRTAVKKVRRR